jgi:hypothetical protein
MRKRELNQEYIVNLTKQMFGASTLSKLSGDCRSSCPDAIYLLFFDRLKEKVQVMKSETLGCICGYALQKDFSKPLGSWSGFIRMTGIEQAHPHPFNQNQTGRQLLEEIAIATLASIACDIARQRGYENDRDWEREADEAEDLGMAEYLHRGSNARQLNRPTGIY